MCEVSLHTPAEAVQLDESVIKSPVTFKVDPGLVTLLVLLSFIKLPVSVRFKPELDIVLVGAIFIRERYHSTTNSLPKH